MISNDEQFYKRLKNGPAVLFLGQEYLTFDTGQEPLLSEVKNKYPEKDYTNSGGYDFILQVGSKPVLENYRAWLNERCRRINPPEWLTPIANYNWSSLYTSAIDSVWSRSFDLEWRELHPIFEEKINPSDPRNKIRLHATYLFGSVSRVDESEQAPLTRIELIKRRQVAIALARRLPEIVSPFGTLVIEGYSSERDWFNTENLLPIIDKLDVSQTHIFSAALVKQDPLIQELVSSGKIILHDESLSSCLIRGESSGWLKLGLRANELESQNRITINQEVASVPLSLYAQVSKSATILDDLILLPPPSISEDRLYSEFRNFLSQSSVKTDWSAYAREFAFQRNFEKQLQDKIFDTLRDAGNTQNPIILHGATGTGKTVALESISYKIKKNQKYPILFIERKATRPNFFDIDSFCKWAEDEGANATLVVWDGMTDIEQYEDLVKFLLSRGRKAVVVGSCYYQERLKNNKHSILAPSHLSPQEAENFKSFLFKIEPSLSNLFQNIKAKESKRFLVALYRLLPPTRVLLQHGVVREVGYAEQEILKQEQDTTIKPSISVLGEALLKAGYSDNLQENILQEIRIVAGEQMTRLEEVIGLIMVPGRFGHKIPIELILRTFGYSQAPNLVKLLRRVDIFRIVEDEVGNIYVGPRHPLEAQLLVQSRLGNPKAEIEFANKLLTEVRAGGYLYENIELNFATELVKSLGPNGQDANYFAPFFPLLSDTLSVLRQERGVINPRLMLQEALLLREFIISQSKLESAPPDTIKTLDKAEDILQNALAILPEDKKQKKLKSMILVELAATLGAKIRHLIKTNQSTETFITCYQQIRQYVFEARLLDPERFHPVDVLLWVSTALLEAKILDAHTEIEVIADILHAFNTIEENELGSQKERYDSRKFVIGTILNSQKLVSEAFESLKASGSTAAYYINTYNIVKDVDLKKPISNSSDLGACERALLYLEQYQKEIEHDGRCLYLMLRLWWIIKAGNPMFFRERQTLPFNQNDWLYLVNLIEKLINLGEQYRQPSLLYIQAIAFFHLNLIERSLELFKETERESEFSQGKRRIMRSYIASNSDGTSQTFNGTVRWINVDKTKGELFVEEIGRSVPFIPLDFRQPDIQKGETLARFNIAFNFIGMIADPPIFSRTRREN